MRIAIYARKSTESEDRQVQSLADQLSALHALAQREGYTVSRVFQESHSAKAPGDRPEFERLMTEIEAGAFEGVLTWSMSRLSRNPVDGGRIAYLLQTERLDFIQTMERKHRPEDNALLMSIENGMATAYLQDLRRNVMRGMQGKVDRGWHSSKAPVGYRNDPESREIVMDPARFDLVRKGWDMMLAGKNSVAEVHRELVAAGLTIASRRRTPQPISRPRLHALFRQPFYAGKIAYKGLLYPGKHHPMVTMAEFESVQSRLREIRARIDRKPQRYAFPFAGALRCKRCGCSVVGEHKQKIYPGTGRTVLYTYYHCSGSKGCPKVSVGHDYIFETFAATMERVRIPAVTVGWLKDALLESLEVEGGSTALTLAELTRKLVTQQARLRRARNLRLDEELGRQEFADLKAEIEGRIEEIKAEHHSVETLNERILRLAYRMLDAAPEADDWTDEEGTAAILTAFMAKVGTCLLNLKRIEIRIDPILQKIAAFEPLRDGSEKPKRGDILPLNSVWWALVEDIRIGAQTFLNQEDL